MTTRTIAPVRRNAWLEADMHPLARAALVLVTLSGVNCWAFAQMQSETPAEEKRLGSEEKRKQELEKTKEFVRNAYEQKCIVEMKASNGWQYKGIVTAVSADSFVLAASLAVSKVLVFKTGKTFARNEEVRYADVLAIRKPSQRVRKQAVESAKDVVAESNATGSVVVVTLPDGARYGGKVTHVASDMFTILDRENHETEFFYLEIHKVTASQPKQTIENMKEVAGRAYKHRSPVIIWLLDGSKYQGKVVDTNPQGFKLTSLWGVFNDHFKENITYTEIQEIKSKSRLTEALRLTGQIGVAAGAVVVGVPLMAICFLVRDCPWLD